MQVVQHAKSVSVGLLVTRCKHARSCCQGSSELAQASTDILHMTIILVIAALVESPQTRGMCFKLLQHDAADTLFLAPAGQETMQVVNIFRYLSRGVGGCCL